VSGIGQTVIRSFVDRPVGLAVLLQASSKPYGIDNKSSRETSMTPEIESPTDDSSHPRLTRGMIALFAFCGAAMTTRKQSSRWQSTCLRTQHA